ncbi:MAG: sigma-70 family RNA polymerase sigma factor [Myxococcota bacterium]
MVLARPPTRGERTAAAADDVALVAEVARGSREALAALYDRHAGVLLGLGQRMLGDRREAEDTLHDVFLEVWRAAADYDPNRAPVRAWLILRMRSRALDRLRSAERRRAVSMGGAEGWEESTRPTASVERVAIQRAMAALPAEQRRVLALGFYEGLSASEIAKREDLPIGTVKSRTAAGLSKLRAALDEVDRKRE